ANRAPSRRPPAAARAPAARPSRRRTWRDDATDPPSRSIRPNTITPRGRTMTTSGDIKTGILMCGHGSRDVDAIAQFEHMTRVIRGRLPDYDVDHAYLEFARPVIRDGLEALKQRGVGRILALPGMLFAAGHVKNDIPWELNSFAVDNPGIAVEYGRDLAI